MGDRASGGDFQGDSCRPISTSFEVLGSMVLRHALWALGRLWGVLQKEDPRLSLSQERLGE